MFLLTDVVKKLLFLNIGVFIIATMILPNIVPGFGLEMNPPFLWDTASNLHPNPNFQPYSIVTHMFMHASPGISHLLWNMVGLFFFGPMVETYLGEKRFVILYMVSGFAAMLLHFIMAYAMMKNSSIVGASGAISGVVFAYIMIDPHRKINLMLPPIAIKGMYLGLIYFAMDLFREYAGSNISGFAHIGGAIAGVLLILHWRKSNFR